MLFLAFETLGQWVIAGGLIAICVLMILVILVQQASGGGLVGAFGGGGATGAFGAKTGDVFTVITVALASVYLLLAVVGNYLMLPGGSVEPSAPAGVVSPFDDGDAAPFTFPQDAGTDQGPVIPGDVPAIGSTTADIDTGSSPRPDDDPFDGG